MKRHSMLIPTAALFRISLLQCCQLHCGTAANYVRNRAIPAMALCCELEYNALKHGADYRRELFACPE